MQEPPETPQALAARLLTSSDASGLEKAGPSAGEGLRLAAAFMGILSKPARDYLVETAETLAAKSGRRPDGARGRAPEAASFRGPVSAPRP